MCGGYSLTVTRQESYENFVQITAGKAGGAAGLSPAPGMKCGREMEGNGLWGPGSTADDPKRWRSGKITVWESSNPDTHS